VVRARFELEPGCTADNDWCEAPEAALGGCSASRGGGIPAALVVVALLVGLRKPRESVVVSALVAIALAGGVARADRPGKAASEPSRTVAAAEIEPDDGRDEQALERDEKIIEAIPDRVTHTWGAALSASGAFDRGGAAASAGLRVSPWESFGFGLDVEYNPWISISDIDVAPGAASIYVPLIWKIKRFGTWEMRSTFYAGATMLLFDLVGADKGSVGPFAGWNPLGLAIPLGGDTKLIVKPGDIVLPIPQLEGIPFYYHQYRFTVGIEWFP
jgi:hypothetical protein